MNSSASVDTPPSAPAPANLFTQLKGILESSPLKDSPNKSTEHDYHLALDALSLFETAHTSIEEIKISLLNPEHSLLEKQEWFLKKTGMACHLTREENPNTPENIIGSLECIFKLSSGKLENFKKNPEILISHFASSNPCFEARCNIFFEQKNEVFTGIDPQKTCRENLTALLNKYIVETTSEEQTFEGFKFWLGNQDAVMGAKASDGKINESALDDFKIYQSTIICVLSGEDESQQE